MLVVWNILIQKLFEKSSQNPGSQFATRREDRGVTPTLLLSSIPIGQQQNKSFASQKSFGGSDFGNMSVFAAYYYPIIIY